MLVSASFDRYTISREDRVVTKAFTDGKEVELTPLSGRIPEQRLVQK